ncbi:MAG: DUF362 domain-containing protein [Selenomonadaceae bacterium]|nr:DUF362 domain-containing protein [Selenomonadaceae bacterium]
MKITRRNFVKLAGIAGLVGLTGVFTSCGDKTTTTQIQQNTAEAERIPPNAKSKVYFSKKIDAEHLIKLYERINSDITGKVAIKVHTGEPNGPNILSPAMVQKFQATIPDSAIVETNTLYEGARSTTKKHRKTLKINGWTFCYVDILDEEGDVPFPVSKGFHLSEVAVGSHLTRYDSLVVLTHFKGHSMGGYGGALKNIAMGCASAQLGKKQVHGLEDTGDWVYGATFMEYLADCGKAICDHFGNQIVFINVLQRLSVDCDCAGTGAAAPEMPDLGILASKDILAVEQASVDMIYNFPDDRKKSLIERIEKHSGLRQLTAMAEHKMGTTNYELITVE